jgi:hypothetical protein
MTMPPLIMRFLKPKVLGRFAALAKVVVASALTVIAVVPFD